VAEEDWILKWDALDIGRKHCPELSDETLWQVLDAITTHRRVYLPDGTAAVEDKPASGDYPAVRQRWPYPVRQAKPPEIVRDDLGRPIQSPELIHSPPLSCHYFVPDLERMFRFLNKSTSSKRGAKPTKRVSDKELRELQTLLKDAASKTPDGKLTFRAGMQLARDRYGEKITRVQVREQMREAKVVTSKPGTRSKTHKTNR
jgi:hypothetical protein